MLTKPFKLNRDAGLLVWLILSFVLHILMFWLLPGWSGLFQLAPDTGGVIELIELGTPMPANQGGVVATPEVELTTPEIALPSQTQPATAVSETTETETQVLTSIQTPERPIRTVEGKPVALPKPTVNTPAPAVDKTVQATPQPGQQGRDTGMLKPEAGVGVGAETGQGQTGLVGPGSSALHMLAGPLRMSTKNLAHRGIRGKVTWRVEVSSEGKVIGQPQLVDRGDSPDAFVDTTRGAVRNLTFRIRPQANIFDVTIRFDGNKAEIEDIKLVK